MAGLPTWVIQHYVVVEWKNRGSEVVWDGTDVSAPFARPSKCADAKEPPRLASVSEGLGDVP